jgi:hypothetical protein
LCDDSLPNLLDLDGVYDIESLKPLQGHNTDCISISCGSFLLNGLNEVSLFRESGILLRERCNVGCKDPGNLFLNHSVHISGSRDKLPPGVTSRVLIDRANKSRSNGIEVRVDTASNCSLYIEDLPNSSSGVPETKVWKIKKALKEIGKSLLKTLMEVGESRAV